MSKTTRRPPRISLRIAITLPAALHLEAKRRASSLSMSFSEYMRSLIRKDLEGGSTSPQTQRRVSNEFRDFGNRTLAAKLKHYRIERTL